MLTFAVIIISYDKAYGNRAYNNAKTDNNTLLHTLLCALLLQHIRMKCEHDSISGGDEASLSCTYCVEDN